jgi:hypothetical protein
LSKFELRRARGNMIFSHLVVERTWIVSTAHVSTFGNQVPFTGELILVP